MQNKPTKVERSQQKLQAAIERLETALAAKVIVGEGGNQTNRSESLQAEIVQLKAENISLKQTSDTVSKRLDQTIGRLKTAIDENSNNLIKQANQSGEPDRGRSQPNGPGNSFD